MLWWAKDGAAYVPFIGDGDIAVELYADRRVFGADIDPERVAVAASRLPDAEVRVADCNLWVFAGERTPFALADFDPFSDPYTSFRAFWPEARKTDPFVCFFTDGERIPLIRGGLWRMPSGEKRVFPTGDNTRWGIVRQYLSRWVWPWFCEFIEPWRMAVKFRYVRAGMVYWGAVVTRR